VSYHVDRKKEKLSSDGENSTAIASTGSNKKSYGVQRRVQLQHKNLFAGFNEIWL